MDSLNILYLALALCAILLAGFGSYALYQLASTLKEARFLVEDIRSIADDIRNIKDNIKSTLNSAVAIVSSLVSLRSKSKNNKK